MKNDDDDYDDDNGDIFFLIDPMRDREKVKKNEKSSFESLRSSFSFVK